MVIVERPVGPWPRRTHGFLTLGRENLKSGEPSLPRPAVQVLSRPQYNTQSLVAERPTVSRCSVRSVNPASSRTG